MWRRHYQRQDPVIGEPMLMETTMDDRYLETIPEVESLRSRRSSVAATLPDLPFRTVPPLNEIHPALRDRQSVTSVYTQPSPKLGSDQLKELNPASSPGPVDISPVSRSHSPVDFAASETSLVSPIESTFTIPENASKSEQQARSQIPRPLKKKIDNMTDGNTSPSVYARKQGTKWNKYTGEETTADTGLPSQATKAQQALEMQFPQLKERTKQILAGLRDKDTETKTTPWGRPPPPVAADPLENSGQKVPWKGPAGLPVSGRDAQVDAIKDNPSARKGPLQFPQRNVSRMTPAQDHARTMSPDKMHQNPMSEEKRSRSISPEDRLLHGELSSRNLPPSRPSPTRSEASIRLVSSQESLKPVAPLKVKSPNATSPMEVQNTASLQSPFHSPHPTQLAGDDPSAVPIIQAPPKPRFGGKSDRYVEPSLTSIPRKEVGDSYLPHEPESRFSWTTYATTAGESPRSTALAQIDNDPPYSSPIMSAPLVVRKRPIPSTQHTVPYSSIVANESRTSVISRKPIAVERERSASLVSMSALKSLPPTPVELEAGDKISTLEARLEDLERRRRNNMKIKRELTEGLKKNAINYDMIKRREVEKLIANLTHELDEITREEHEVGLNLHRSKKKRDREDFYENPTGLWIKRVTS